MKTGIYVTMVLTIVLMLGACGQTDPEPEKSGMEALDPPSNSDVAAADPYLWLEEVLGEESMNWVRAENARSLGILQSDPRFQQLQARALEIYNAPDKIVYATRYGDEMHDLWRDEENARGLWRKTTVEAYAAAYPIWETVLDIDALARHENRNWVYKGRSCLMSAGRCMVQLSDGGTDAVQLREFDVANRRFVEGGFVSPNAKQSAAWLDEDTLLIATDFGPDSVNTSGYPRQIRLWNRGTVLSDARLLFTGPTTDAMEIPQVSHREDGTHALVIQAPDFFTQTLHLLEKDGSLSSLALPQDVSFKGFLGDQLIALLRSDWNIGNVAVSAGSVVSVAIDDLVNGTPGASLQTVYSPDALSSVKSVTVTRSRVFIALLSNVTGKLIMASASDDGWMLDDVALPGNGSITLRASDESADDVFVSFESFLQPESLYRVFPDGEVRLIQALPERFDAAGFITEQKFATSTDGTQIPYFVIRPQEPRVRRQAPDFALCLWWF